MNREKDQSQSFKTSTTPSIVAFRLSVFGYSQALTAQPYSSQRHETKSKREKNTFQVQEKYL